MKKIDKHYVSQIDKDLAAFDATHEKSPAQLTEYLKYQAIYQLRDEPTEQNKQEDSLWD